MYSGKSSALVDHVERVARASRNAVVLRPARDTRTTALLTHAGRGIAQGLARFVTELRVAIAPPGHRQAGAGVVWPRVSPDVRLVALDEVQFLPVQPVVAFVAAMQARGFDVVCAGLDLDSRGVPFDTVAALLALADTVVKSTAVCVCCGADARRSQRITRDTARVSVGGEGQYEARCRECWVPDEE
jgi:thymidine kinase